MSDHAQSVPAAWVRLGPGRAGETGAAALASRQQLERFLAGVERRAFRIARLALGNPDDAMDVVQDTMLKLVERYATRPEDELAPLFYTILRRRIADVYRRRAVRNKIVAWFGGIAGDDGTEWDPVAQAPDPNAVNPSERMANEQMLAALGRVLQTLPARQREAFMLRILEGLDVAQTAAAMRTSEGSVKTHLSRAVHSLRARLESHL